MVAEKGTDEKSPKQKNGFSMSDLCRAKLNEDEASPFGNQSESKKKTKAEGGE